MSKDDDDALLHYGAWVNLGVLAIFVYRKVFGSLDGIAAAGKGLKRKPSGAELSAWIGHATQVRRGLTILAFHSHERFLNPRFLAPAS
jgi:hypothetical protein